MVNLITKNGEGHKVATPITNREEYYGIRNTPSNRNNFQKGGSGDDFAKRQQVQFNYNDQLPNGLLAGCNTAASTFSHDIDCRDEQECKEIAQRILQHKEELGLLELSRSANWGLHPICRRVLGLTILENQIRFSLITHTEMDCNAHDEQRVMFTGPADESVLLYLDDSIFDEPLTVEEGKAEYQLMREREERGEEKLPANFKKGEKHYRPWEDAIGPDWFTTCTDAPQTTAEASTSTSTEPQSEEAETYMVFNHPVADYVNCMFPNGAPKGQRHKTMLKLANDLVVLLDNDADKVKKALLQFDWVQNVVKERKMKELDDVIDSAQKLLKKRESESFYTVRPSKNMVAAIEQLTGRSYKSLLDASNVMLGSKKASDEQVEMLLRMGERIRKFNAYFPLLKLFCHRRKPIHYIAALFVGGGFCTTLMTRCWYSFYPKPGHKCRINSLVMVIGRPASGKSFAVDLYKLLMEPIKKDDQAQIDALNAYNAEREQNNGASKSSTVRPTSIYRCLPAETSAAAIREAEFNAKEMIDGEEWPLHVSIFDSELNHTLSQMKKSHMDAFMTLWLKSFSNEMGGALLKTSSSPVGEYPIHFNAVYTGTYDAFEKIASESTYNSGTTTRFACVPMGPSLYEMMEYRQYTQEDSNVEQQIREWAYKLDRTIGEIPTEELSKALYQWTSRKMDEAREEQSEVLEEMLKRPAWVGINFALPFIVSRHWGEMVQDKNDKFRCGVGFHIDKKDIELALFIAQAQYDFQQYFFYDLGQKQHEKQIAKSYGKKPQSRTMQAFTRLPEVFSSSDVMHEFDYDNNNSVNSCIKRLKDDGRIKKIRRGEDKGKYRKLV
ncbi:MAG: hypothetical protein II404_09560 [Prevotella sp.]|nr:hypothetical protein [Prevotella sp.]